MHSFTAADETTHPFGKQKYWNESFYMNFFDAQTGWGGATRVGYAPVQRLSDGLICLFFPDNTAGFIRTWQDRPEHREVSPVGALEHICEKPLEKWRVRYKGPIFHFQEPGDLGAYVKTWMTDIPKKDFEMDLEFNAIHEVFDFHASMKKGLIPAGELIKKFSPGYLLHHLGPAARKLALLTTMSKARHYEHSGRISGILKVDNKVHEISGFGQRDHSWGVRDMRVPANWRWFSGQFGQDLCFNATKVDALIMRASGGYVFSRGKARGLSEWTLTPEYEPTGLWAVRSGLDLLDTSGRRFNIRAETMENLPINVQVEATALVVNEARARFRSGDLEGCGISEFMGQLM